MKDSYASKTEAIEHGILPALGEHAGDFDADKIYERYYTVLRDVDENGMQVGDIEIIPRWTLEHPDWEEQDGRDLFWNVVQRCALPIPRTSRWPEGREGVGRLLDGSFVWDRNHTLYFIYNDLGSIASADFWPTRLSCCQDFMKAWGKCLCEGDEDAFLHAVADLLGRTDIVDSPEYIADNPDYCAPDEVGYWTEIYEEAVEEIANGLERGEFVELTPEALLSTFCERDLMLTRYEICFHYPGVMQEMDRLGLSNYVEAPFEEEGPDGTVAVLAVAGRLEMENGGIGHGRH